MQMVIKVQYSCHGGWERRQTGKTERNAIS